MAEKISPALIARGHQPSHRVMRGVHLPGWTDAQPRMRRPDLAMMVRVTIASVALLVAGCTSYRDPYVKYGRRIAPTAPSSEQVDHRLLLIGDAGDADPDGEAVLQLLARHMREIPDRTTVTFLGDNVYERGMPAEEPTILDGAAQVANVILPKLFDSRKEAERCLTAQIDVVRGTSARAIFIPGNHDWDPFETGGWTRVLQQESFIRASARENVDVSMLPEGGCPGPVSVPLGKHGTMIVLDTQWWLAFGTDSKPAPGNNPTGCRYTTEHQVTDALIAELTKAAREKRWVIVAAHHPLNSMGPHGGFVEPITHLFPMRYLRHYVPWYLEWIPMPVLGTFAVMARRNFSPSPQDASNDHNQHLRDSLRNAMAEAENHGAPTLAYAAGHDHSLQVFRTARGPRYTLVSGLGSSSRASEVGRTHNTLFAHANPKHAGFMQIDFLNDGQVRLSVIETDGTPAAGMQEVYSTMLVDAQTPRTRPPPPPGRWTRMKQRASSAWQWWRSKLPQDDDEDEDEVEVDFDLDGEQDSDD